MRKYLYGLILSLVLVFGHCNTCQAGDSNFEAENLALVPVVIMLAPLCLACIPIMLGTCAVGLTCEGAMMGSVMLYKACFENAGKDGKAKNGSKERKEAQKKEQARIEKDEKAADGEESR